MRRGYMEVEDRSSVKSFWILGVRQFDSWFNCKITVVVWALINSASVVGLWKRARYSGLLYRTLNKAAKTLFSNIEFPFHRGQMKWAKCTFSGSGGICMQKRAARQCLTSIPGEIKMDLIMPISESRRAVWVSSLINNIIGSWNKTEAHFTHKHQMVDAHISGQPCWLLILLIKQGHLGKQWTSKYFTI